MKDERGKAKGAKKNNNRRKRMVDTTINNTLRLLISGSKQVFGFGRNVMILDKQYIFAANTFNRVSLAGIFGQDEFIKRKELFKYVKVNNIVCVIYPRGLDSAVENTIMLSWTRAGLVEGDIQNDDTSRNFYLNNTKPIHFSWKPPSTVVDLNSAFLLNKPFDITKTSNFPGWIYVLNNAQIKVTIAMNITLISNDVGYVQTERDKQVKLILDSDKVKFFSFPKASSVVEESKILNKSE